MNEEHTALAGRRALWLPKGGHASGEYEDAFALSEPGSVPFRAAVADGATEAAFAGQWARQLTEGFVKGKAPLAEQLPAWQQAWAAEVEAQRAALPWYAAEKAEQGAFAAVLGFTLMAPNQWHAAVVGDCNLFHLRDGALRQAWPFSDPEAFGHHPALVPSRAAQALPEVCRTEGHCRPGDAFLLASDALAAYLLRTGAAAALRFTAETFPQVVADARAAGMLRNDDVTLLVLRLPEDGLLESQA